MTLLLADAGPIVGFVAGNQHGLLWQVVEPAYETIEVSSQVNEEITRVARSKTRKASTNYAWMVDQGQCPWP